MKRAALFRFRKKRHSQRGYDAFLDTVSLNELHRNCAHILLGAKVHAGLHNLLLYIERERSKVVFHFLGRESTFHDNHLTLSMVCLQLIIQKYAFYQPMRKFGGYLPRCNKMQQFLCIYAGLRTGICKFVQIHESLPGRLLQLKTVLSY